MTVYFHKLTSNFLISGKQRNKNILKCKDEYMRNASNCYTEFYLSKNAENTKEIARGSKKQIDIEKAV